jgi:hypothetical protein
MVKESFGCDSKSVFSQEDSHFISTLTFEPIAKLYRA